MASHILISIDVEDWFQVENFKPWIPFSSWPAQEFRVEKNIHRLLDLFDSISLNHSGTIQATFFILGWIAERLPNLFREVQSRGHEIASHGYNHHLCTFLSASDLQKDLEHSKKLLEDITGSPVFGYRAPSFAINDQSLKIIETCGYKYDSSYNSFDKHGRYGQIDLSGSEKIKSVYKFKDTFYEIPVSNINCGRQVLPWGGGGYFRLIPSPIFIRGVRSILNHNDAYVFYMHPWEIDADQPRVTQASLLSKFRHYVNIHKTELKLRDFIRAFTSCEFTTCSQYLKSTFK